jgi:NADPH2:quinone reductase
MQTHAIRIHENGRPEIMRWEEVEVGEPGKGEVRIRQTAVGFNFLDTYHRSGLYKLPLPAVLGTEAAGVVEALGEDASGFREGDRVAYAGILGAYAEARVVPADRLVPLPAWIDDRLAASMLLKGMTTEYLLMRCHPIKSGDTIVIHAAAGATGGLMCQWAKSVGAHVIGTVGSEAKIGIAESNGAEHVVLTSDPNWVAKVRDITDGVGVPVVYDSIGKDTFEGSLDCLMRRGTLVSFGNASGAVPPFAPGTLTTKGSLYLTRPGLQDYIFSRHDLMESAAALFEKVHQGAVKPSIDRTFALKDAAEAHLAIETRTVTGSIVLLP